MSDQVDLHQLYHDEAEYKENQTTSLQTLKSTCLPKNEIGERLYIQLKQLQNQAFASLPLESIVHQVVESAAFL